MIGLNDQTKWDLVNENQPAFDYFAVAEVDKVEDVPKGMKIKKLPAG